MRLLRQPHFLIIALSHMIVDTLSGQVGILLAVLSVPLALSNAMIGFIAMLYSVLGALSQPVFGWLHDRHGGRVSAAGGVLWMAFFFALVAVAPGYWILGFLVLATLGSGAFHPMGTTRAAEYGNRHMAGQVATAASIFFLFGQGGWAIGPAIGGLILDHLGRAGILILAGCALAIGLSSAYLFHPSRAPQADDANGEAPGPDAGVLRPDVGAFLLIVVLAGLRTWASTATTTFAPKFYHDQGFTASTFGLISALFMGGSAVGGVFGGVLGDRWGIRRTVAVSLLLSLLPLYFFPLSHGAAIFILITLAGFFNGAPHPILVTMAQRALPGRAGLAAGLALGFMFAVGAMGTYVSGLAGDQIGLARVLQANALISLVAVPISLKLRVGLKRERSPLIPAGD